MVAYPDKVTCDRETFLHSKLEARNFILQEHKDLKGISNPGPVYEFKEETTYIPSILKFLSTLFIIVESMKGRYTLVNLLC